MVYYTSKDTMLFQNPTVADFTTTSNDFVDVYTWMTHFCSSKRLKFEASNLPLVVKILVSNDGGATFEDPTFTNTYTIVPGTPIETNIDDFYSALKIQVKPLYDNQPGTLSTHIAGSSIPNAAAAGGSGAIGQHTMAGSSAVVIASDQTPVTVAGETAGGVPLPLLVDASGHLMVVGGGGGAGDASAENQVTQIAIEQAIFGKIIAAPATEANQDTIKTSIDAINTTLTNVIAVAGKTSGGTKTTLLTDADGTLHVTGGGSGGGDASAANQLTQISAEQSILAKIIAAPATEAKQDTQKTSIDAVKTSVDAVNTNLTNMIAVSGLTSGLTKTPLLVSSDGTLHVTGGTGGGDASAANQLTQISAEQSILAKIIAAPATEAKQDTIISLMGGGGQTYKGQYRTTTTGASESITIPTGSTQAQIFAAKDSEAYLNINAASTASSPIHTNEFTLVSLNLGGVTSLTAWVTTGNIGVVFYG